MNWRIGQKVVCIQKGDKLEGAVCTIRDISGCRCCTLLSVAECVSRFHHSLCQTCGTHLTPSNDEWWWEDCFRPLDTLSDQLQRIETQSVTIHEPQPELA